jgi:hypothetical protein
MNASSSSFPAVVENDGEVMLETEADLSVDLIWSMAMALHAGMPAAKINSKPKARLSARPTRECILAIRAAAKCGASRRVVCS